MTKELEIKILDVNVSEVEDKLQKLGCKKTLDVLQKLYVYDVMTIRGLYHSIIVDWNDTSSDMNDVVINRVKQLFLELNSVITKEDNLQLCSKLNIDSLISVSQEIVFNDIWYNFLTSKVFNSIIEKYGVNTNKWIRLRQTGNQVTLTVKHILENPNTTEGLQQYGLSSINETELDVESIELARKFLETLGFYHRNYQEKKRISYVYESMSLEIEIDSWPLIPPYIEIEGKTEEEIYSFAKLLGYSVDDIKIANTSAVYEMYGINIYDYKELKFDQKEEK